MPQPQLVLEPAIRKRVIEELTRGLKAFHEAEERNEGGYKSVSYRGQLCGVRATLTILLGATATSEILDAVRTGTGLQFPHVGPVNDDGSIFGMDLEAGHGL